MRLGRRTFSPPGGVPGHRVTISLGSLGTLPSPGIRVSASACFDSAAAANPSPIIVRRSIEPSHYFARNITPFSFCGQGVLFAAMKLCLAFLFLFVAHAAMAADDGPAYGPQLEGYAYPFPVQHYRFQSQGVAMDMAYMDVKPAAPNGHAVVLLHGKNFCAATWDGSIRALSAAGYRVI